MRDQYWSTRRTCRMTLSRRVVAGALLLAGCHTFSAGRSTTDAALPSQQGEAPHDTVAAKTLQRTIPKPELADPDPEGVRIDENEVFANYFPGDGAGKHPAIIGPFAGYRFPT